MAKNAITDWDIVAANNLDIATITLQENQTLPSQVNNFERAHMAQIAQFYDDLGANNTVGGTANAITITLAEQVAALAVGLVISFKNTVGPNTGATTLAATNSAALSLGTKAIRLQGDSALVGGEMQANGVYLLRYDTAYNSASGAWVLLNPSASVAGYLPLAGGTLTGTLISAPSGANAIVYLNSPSSSFRSELAFQRAGATHFELFENNDATGDIVGYVTDNSAVSRLAIQMVRASGAVIFGNTITAVNSIDGYTTTATAAGTTTLIVASNEQQYFTGTSTQTVVLPVASTLTLGQTYRIVNNSTGKVTVQSSGANTIKVMGGTLITLAPGAPGTELIVTCILTSGTGTASWDYEYRTPTTDWVSYTPTFTNLGTATSIFVESRRVGDTLQVRGKFTTGTVVASEVRVSLGFNGTDGNVTTDSTKVPSVQISGIWQGTSPSGQGCTLADSAVAYMNFSASGAPTTKITGSSVGNSSIQTITFEAPITGA